MNVYRLALIEGWRYEFLSVEAEGTVSSKDLDPRTFGWRTSQVQLPVFPEPQFKSHRPVLGLSDRTHPDTKNIRELIECRAVPRRMNCRSCVASWPRNCGSDPELLESAESQ